MSRRLFYIVFGATAGVLAVRRASQAARAFTPAGVQESVSGALGGAGGAFDRFRSELRAGMAEREAELRSGLGLDGTHDVVDAGVPGR